ncbi:MAG: tetratricopeptide repeat protein [Planctomycetes bacterium]|nr:tetratricopeptide repeat protein [Planctomycetota bacterium]
MAHASTASHRLATALVAEFVPATPEGRAPAGFPARLKEVVEALGGRLEGRPGRRTSAVFGLPHGEEEDAVRAVRAGLAVHREIAALGPEGALRVGVFTRDVPWPRPGAGRSAVVDEILAAAARLAASARPGAVLVSPATERAACARIRFRKPDPPAGDAFEAVGEVETRRDFREDVAVPTIGRDAEVARLMQLHEGGAGGFLLVEGDAGVGKSRVLYEFRRRLQERQDGALVAVGRAHEGPQPPLEAFSDFVRSAAGVSGLERGDGAKLSSWIETHLSETIPDPIDRENCAHLIALSLGLFLPDTRVTHIEPARMRAETHYAWVRWLRSLASRQPVVLSLEDLHWADDGTLALMESLAAGLAGERVMILGARRPAARTPRGYERMRLEELPRDSSLRLAETILRGPISEELGEFLVQQSGGNPYYLEELSRYLVESGLVVGQPLRLHSRPERLPEGLQGLLVARIDGLGPEDSEVLKAASVVGPSFWVGLLERALFRKVDRALERARRRQLVVPHARSLIPGDQELAFRHALLRDAAYSLLGPRERARLHRVVADLLEHHIADGGRRVKALVATHREAAGQREEPARLWQEAAAEALRESAYAEALGHAAEARRLGRGPAAHLVAARAYVRLAKLEEALVEAAAVAGSPDASAEEVASARLIEAEVHGRRGELEKFLVLVEQVAAANPPGLVLLEALVRKARVLWNLGRHDEALRVVAEVRTRLQALPAGAADREGARLLADSHNIEGLVHWKQGHPREATTAYEQALALARSIGDRVAIASTLNSMGALHRDLRADVQARAAFEEALAMLRAIGDRIGIAGALANLGLVYREAGALSESVAAHRESLGILRQTGDLHVVSRGLKALSDALLDGGRLLEALQALDEALDLARRSGDRGAEMLAVRNLGQVHAALGEEPRALEEYRQALAMARVQENGYNEVFILVREGELHAASGRTEEAERTLAAALKAADERRLPELLVSAHIARARLRAASSPGDATEDARSALTGAVSTRNVSNEACAAALLARCEAAAGDAASAREKLDRALALAPRCGVFLERLHLYEDEARVRLALGDRAGAARAAAEGEKTAREQGARRAAARFGEILLSIGSGERD